MAIKIVSSVLPVNAAPGQAVQRVMRFTSTTSLANRTLEIDVAMYTDFSSSGFSSAFSIWYPISAGTYDFDQKRNWKMQIIVEDSKNFLLVFTFFVTKPYNLSQSNSALRPGDAFFVRSDIDSSIRFILKSIDLSNPRGVATTGSYYLPVNISSTCKKSIQFEYEDVNEEIIDGYVPGEDLSINLKIPESVGNNYEVGFYREDAVGDTQDLQAALGLNYAVVNSAVNDIYDLPTDVFKSARSFKTISGESFATVTIDGAFIKKNATYRLYVVFKVAGTNYMCISDPIIEKIKKKLVAPTITNTISDGTSTSNYPCASGLMPDESVSVIVTADKASYNSALASAGISGDYDSRFLYRRAYKAKFENATIGVTLPLASVANNVVSVNFLPNSGDAVQFIIAEFAFQMDGYVDHIYKVIRIEYNNTIVTEAPVMTFAGNPAKYICIDQDGAYTITNLGTTGCINKVSINKGPYELNPVLSGNVIDSTLLELGDEVCILSRCNGTPVNTAPASSGDPDQCQKLKFNLVASNNCLEDYKIYYTTGTSTIYTLNVPAGGSANVEHDEPITVLFTDAEGDCSPIYNIESGIEFFDCPEVEVFDKDNWASINWSVDTSTGTATISKTNAFSSAVDTEEYLASFDGINFIPTPSTVTGEDKVYVVYRATFTDGSPPIQIEEVITITKDVECENYREIDLSESMGQLQITLTDSIGSTPRVDKLFVIINGGDPIEFDLLGSGYTPINLEGGEKIEVYTYTVFEEACADMQIEKSIKIDEIITSTACDSSYETYSLEVDYDTETNLFTVTKNGSLAALEVDDAKWTIDNGNPFDENNTGVPYTNPVIGAGLFIVRWKLKLPNCPMRILDAFAYGTRTTSIKLPPIDINIPNTVQMCNVNCCVSAWIECDEGIATVMSGDSLAGFTIEWSGPGGWTYTGNPATLPDVEGTYTAVVTGTNANGACSTTVSYYHDMPEAGTPTDTIIIVQ